MPAGSLKHRLSFQKRAVVDDGYGNTEGDFAEEFQRWAEVRPLRGGEAVMAARLAGQQPVLIRVMRDSDTLEIQPDWQAVDLHEGTTYALHSVADMEQKWQYLTMTATAGVAA